MKLEDFNAHAIYRDIISLSYITDIKPPVRYSDRIGGNLHMTGHDHPVSLKADEFQYIAEKVADWFVGPNARGPFKGFECATGFGISTIAPLMALKLSHRQDHRLVSMDAYIEENDGTAEGYEKSDPKVFTDSDGYKSAKFLSEMTKTSHMLSLECGWSPRDTGPVIEKHFGKEPSLTYAFLDAGHFPEQIIIDFDAIFPYMKPPYLFFFHDVYEKTFTEKVRNHIGRKTGQEITIVVESRPEHLFYTSRGGENLGLIEVY